MQVVYGKMRDTTGEITIRTAGQGDRLAICSLLQQAWHSAGGARWDQLNALETSCAALLACRGPQVVGLCLFDLRAPPVARLSAVAVADREEVSDVWQELWLNAEQYLRNRTMQFAYYVGEAPWLLEALAAQRFSQVNTLITYEKIQDEPLINGQSKARLRPLRPGDLATVAEIDAASFPLLWRYPAAMLEASLSPRARLVIAELDRRLVGYQLSTQEGNEGQIIRLAVLPEFRRQAVGSQLLADSLAAFRRSQVRRIVLNTQNDNLPAHKLYAKFGFQPTGEELPVLHKELTG